jgi:hypothetical protein
MIVIERIPTRARTRSRPSMLPRGQLLSEREVPANE